MRSAILIFTFLFCSIHVESQTNVLLIGNHQKICVENDSLWNYSPENRLPANLNEYDVLMIFSTSTSILKKEDIFRIREFLSAGHGVYLGCENWPMQAEGNQVSRDLMEKEFWGDNHTTTAVVSNEEENLLKDLDYIPAGNTTVQFPMDHRLKVEAWVNDEPLILSSEEFGGKLILDGGYSRFYCSEFSGSKDVWVKLLDYLGTR